MVAVAAPMIALTDCTATLTVRVVITVRVTLAHLAPGDRYDVSGQILELDGRDDNADVCGSLTPQAIPAAHGGWHVVELDNWLKAADVGLVKGIGPASDETSSPDMVELFAQVWLRNLTTGVSSGPWVSPPRAVVAHERQTWLAADVRLGSELAMPRAASPHECFSHHSAAIPAEPEKLSSDDRIAQAFFGASEAAASGPPAATPTVLAPAPGMP